jgi:hypothetical protein
MSNKSHLALATKQYWIELGQQRQIDRFNHTIAPLLDAKNARYADFLYTVGKIETAAQLCQGEALRNHLQYLSPDMTKAADHYINSLIALNRQYGGNLELEDRMNSVHSVVAELKDRINSVLAGNGNGDELKKFTMFIHSL